MGKHGPCYHCGVTSTPLWRNGPPEKPVLCNACGSRWRTKGTLTNYTPLHARAEPDEFEDYKVSSKAKTVTIKNKESKVLKRKSDNSSAEFGGFYPLEYSDHGFRKVFDEDISNRSSSGSAISNSESCVQYGGADASDLTGPPAPVVLSNAKVPSRKRTCIATLSEPFEKLTKDLYTIWHEQQSSCSTNAYEEDLLLESGKSMVSVEIGHGSVLIRHPNSIGREEESEASSISVEKKKKCEVDSRKIGFSSVLEDTGVNSLNRGFEKIKKNANFGAEQERIKRDKEQLEKLQILAHHNSPLRHIDLQDIVNFDKFASHLMNEEQQQLLKFLPCIDTAESPESLKSMFDSPQFKENLQSFQRLVGDGVFDNSFSGVKTEDYRTLKKLILCNSSKSKWVKQYQMLKDLNGKNCIKESEIANGSHTVETDDSTSAKISGDGQNHKFSGAKAIMKKPAKITIKSNYDRKEPIDNKSGSFFSPKSLFSLQNDSRSSFIDESCDQDLLLDVPSNNSFPQAELLFLPSSSLGAQASTSSSSVYPNLLRP